MGVVEVEIEVSDWVPDTYFTMTMHHIVKYLVRPSRCSSGVATEGLINRSIRAR